MFVFVIKVVSTGQDLILLAILCLRLLVEGLNLPMINIDKVAKLRDWTKMIDKRFDSFGFPVRINID